MKCPYCHHCELKVIDSRDANDMNATRRRRECLKCLQRFTTFETVELSMQVKKKDGSYEDFQIQKLINGLDAACRHTTISHDKVIALANKISDYLLNQQLREVTTTQLGECVMDHLQQLDPVAYIRFACVYKRFTDINELEEALKTVQCN